MSEGHFERLDAEECVQLLREASIGRLAFSGPDGLTVLPLSFTVDEGRVVLRTAGSTQLAELPQGSPVAFEVDDFDTDYRNGWSVLVRGSLVHLDAGQLQAAAPTPFVPGQRALLLGVSLDQLTGRAVSADI